MRARIGLGNIPYLASVSPAAPHVCLAHCVWVDADEQVLLARRGVKVLHCPGSNLVGLRPGAGCRRAGRACRSRWRDGAACNNDPTCSGMRLAATLQAVRQVRRADRPRCRAMATVRVRGPARRRGGTIEVGKRRSGAVSAAVRTGQTDPYTRSSTRQAADVRAVRWTATRRSTGG